MSEIFISASPSLSLRRTLCLSLVLFCSSFAPASQVIKGTVVNGTTGKPSAGDDIALLTIDHGMLEVSRGKTAGDGTFSLHTNAPGKHILRARHDDVIYQEEVMDGVAPQLKVFDALPELTGIHGEVTVMKIESMGANLNVTELHSIANESNPPRTQADSRNLEILLPAKAILDSVVVEAPSSRPEKVKAKPVATGSQQYAVGYPLRPGTTQFAIKYHLPYPEKAVIRPRLQYPTKLWTVVVPQSMRFKAPDHSLFHRLMDQNGMQVQALSRPKAGELPEFGISGGGTLPPKRLPVSVQTISAELAGLPSSHLEGPASVPSSTVFVTAARKILLYVGIAGIILLLGIRIVARETAKRV